MAKRGPTFLAQYDDETILCSGVSISSLDFVELRV